MDVMGAVGLNKIRKPTRATDAGDGRNFFMPHFALFDQLEVKREHGEIAAARAPRRMVGGHFLLGQPFALLRGDRRHGCQIPARGQFEFRFAHSVLH